MTNEELEVQVADKLAKYFKEPIDIPCPYCAAAKAIIPIIREAEREENIKTIKRQRLYGGNERSALINQGIRITWQALEGLRPLEGGKEK